MSSDTALTNMQYNGGQEQQGQTTNYLDGKHNMVVRIWICGDNKEVTGQKLLVTTHCIRPSNGWNLKTTIRTYTNKRALAPRAHLATASGYKE